MEKQAHLMLVEGQVVRLVFHRQFVVIPTTGVVIRTTKARVQGSQPCKHLPPVQAHALGLVVQGRPGNHHRLPQGRLTYRNVVIWPVEE